MKKTTPRQAAVVFLFLALWCFVFLFAEAFVNKTGSIGLRFEGDGTSMEELETALDAQDISKRPQATGWRYGEKVTVSVPGTGRSSQMDAILLYGEPQAAISDGLAAGVWKAPYDTDGCMLTTGAAYALFGSTDVVGLTLICQGREWLIRGLVSRKNSWILLPAKEEDRFRCMELNFGEKENPLALADNFWMTGGLTGTYQVLDWPLLKAAVRVCCFLPAWALFLSLLIYKNRPADKRKRGWSLLAGAVILFLLIVVTFRFPTDWIPTRWSDLGFWSERLAGLKKTIGTLWSTGTYEGDLYLGSRLILTAASSIGACIWILAAALGFKKSFKK